MKKFVSLFCILVLFTGILGSFSVNAASPVEGFQVSGSKLLDANGNEFIMRGVNHAHTWYKNELATTIPALAKAGCNAVRIVLSNGEQWTKDSSSSVSNIISMCEQNKLIAVLEVHDATGYNDEASLLEAANYFVEIKSALVGKEDTVIINIANEWGGTWDSAAWASGYKKAIPIIRNAGLTHTILVDSTGWGQYGTCVKEKGKEVFNADTLKNTMFAVHMYGYAGKDEATIKSMIDGAHSQELAICVGEFGWDHSDGDVDEATIMSYCQQKNVGWLAWSWKGNGGGVEYLDMAYDWSGNSLSEWGDDVVNGSNGLMKTSEICSVFTGGGQNTPAPTPTESPSPTPTNNFKYGDLNESGQVDSTDVTLIKRYLLRRLLSFPTATGELAADVNADQSINSTDLTLIKRYILRKIDKFPAEETIIPGNPGFLYNGRFDFSDPQGPKCAWSGSNIELNFSGTEASVTLKSTGENWFQAIVDGNVLKPFMVNSTSTVKLVTGLSNTNHHLVLWKRTEASQGEVQILGFDFGQGELLAPPAPLERKIEFIGDSITCAYGNEGASKEQPFTPKNENSYLSYAAITARSLNASANIIAWSGIGLAMNYGGSGGPLMLDRYPFTLPQSGTEWDFKDYVPQVVVINLGTNDFSTTPADRTKFISAYKDLVTQVRTNYPNSHIFCCVGPMLWGSGLDSCRSYITEVINDFESKGDSKVYFVEFPQQDASNGYGEDWHPSLTTHELMADQLTSEIKDRLGW